MTTIHREGDAGLDLLAGAQIAVVGYGNQGRSWALNLRDCGLAVQVCARADASREQAKAEGFTVGEVAAASAADVICVLVPDDVIPSLALRPSERALTVLASGYTYAFVLSPALAHVSTSFVTAMLEHNIPLEAIMTELVLSGEVERTYRLLREQGFAQQMEYHSPTSQYGQLSRRSAYDHLDVIGRMRELTADIASGRFADEWDHERDAGHQRLAELKEQFCGALVREFEADLRRRLGPEPAGS